MSSRDHEIRVKALALAVAAAEQWDIADGPSRQEVLVYLREGRLPFRDELANDGNGWPIVDMSEFGSLPDDLAELGATPEEITDGCDRCLTELEQRYDRIVVQRASEWLLWWQLDERLRLARAARDNAEIEHLEARIAAIPSGSRPSL